MSTVSDELNVNEDTQKDRYLTFHLAGEDYAFEIFYVTEIVGIMKITDVPETPPYVKGVINLRGQVIPVMDVRLRFNLDERAYDERTCIIVVRVDTTAIGLVVDKVNEVVDIPENRVEQVSHQGASDTRRFIRGMGKLDTGVKIVLNLENLLYDEEMQLIEEE